MMSPLRVTLPLFGALSCTAISPALAQDVAVVVKQTVYPGQSINAAEIAVVDASNCPNCNAGFIRDPELVRNRVAVKTLAPGRLIFPGDLRKAAMAVPGHEVELIYHKGALLISMRGDPVSEAGVGDAVSVRNKDSKAIVNGIVQADGTVLVVP
jgi:flagellar basal body P-ring formation protein FlgA